MTQEVDHGALSAQIAEKIGLSANVSHAELREGFLEHLKKQVNQPTLDQVKSVGKALEELCTVYFDYNNAIIKQATANIPKGNDHPDAASMKTQAGAIERGLQKAMVAFLHCELLLYTTMNVLDVEIEEAIKESGEGEKNIQWSYALPDQIALACRRRDVLSESLVKMRRVKAMVEKLDPVYNFLEGELGFLLSENNAKALMDEFNGQLRQLRFSKAEHIIQRAHEKDSRAFFRTRKKDREKRWVLVLEISSMIIKLVEKVAEHLRGRENKVFLRSWELNLAYEDTDKHLIKTREFIEKYEVPEIKFRRDALNREKDRLYEIATFEGYLELLENMQKGCAMPMVSLKDVRHFEAECYKKAIRATEDKAKMVEQTQTKIEELVQGPDPESIPDDMLFAEDFDEDIQHAKAS